MEIAVRTERRGEVERCPYCHDLAGGDALVECTGCGTSHHADCVAELGRCTVLGCERPLVAPAGSPAAPSGQVREEIRRRARAGMAAVRQQAGDRARAKAQVFVDRNTSPAEVATDASIEGIRDLGLLVEELTQAQRWAALAPVLVRLLELELLVGGGADRPDLRSWVLVDELRAAIDRATTRGRDRSASTAMAIGLALLILPLLIAVLLAR